MAYRETEKTRANRVAITEKIIRATFEIVSEVGFSGAQMSQIAVRAQVATGSLYRYFPSKGELFAEIFRMATQIEYDAVNQNINSDLPPPQRLKNTVEAFALRAIKGKQMAYSLIAEPVDPAVEAERLHFRRMYAELFAKLIREGIESGCFRVSHPDVASAAIVGALAESLVGPLSPQSESPDTSRTPTPSVGDSQALVSAIAEFCLQAVSANKETI